MNTQIKLLDKARGMCNPQTDTQLAKKLGVTKAAVSLWRNGSNIKDGHLMALIKLAQADPALVVLVRTEGADAETKKAWEIVWDRLSPVTTVIGGLVLALNMMPTTAGAKPLEIKQMQEGGAAFCILCSSTSRIQRARSIPNRATS